MERRIFKTSLREKIFEAIKGTNKTISLESNGIRWIFNGKDITDVSIEAQLQKLIESLETNFTSQYEIAA